MVHVYEKLRALDADTAGVFFAGRFPEIQRPDSGEDQVAAAGY